MKNLKDIFEGIMDKNNRQTVGSNLAITEIEQFLKENYQTAKFIISEKPNKNGMYEVSCDGTVSTKWNPRETMYNLTNGKFVFSEVKNFIIETNTIKSLVGAPRIVKNLMSCFNCAWLETLEGFPEQVGGRIDLRMCIRLKSLEGLPKTCGSLTINKCHSLTSLKGAPKKITDVSGFDASDCENLVELNTGTERVVGNFDCTCCPNLKSLVGAPKVVKGNFYCDRRFSNAHIAEVTTVMKNICKY